MKQIIEHYNVGKITRNKICCPFHSEKTSSFFIKGIFWKCFGCGEGGDIIRFMQKYFNIDFQQAVVKLDYDFNLNLGVGKCLTLREKREQDRKQRERTQEINEAKRLEKQIQDNYWAAFDEELRLTNNKREFAPKTMDEPLHDLYVESLQKLDYAKYLLDCEEQEGRKKLE